MGANEDAFLAWAYDKFERDTWTHAHIENALRELSSLRSDIISELGFSPNDSFLKARFVESCNHIESQLRKAMT